MSKNPTFRIDTRLNPLLSDTGKFTDESKNEPGLGYFHLSAITGHATNRLKFLDELELLISNPNTSEAAVHTAIENNLWVLGREYASTFSNEELEKAVEEYLDRKFIATRAAIRPDLYLGENSSKQGLLIEFKHPVETIRRDSETMALRYRDDLNSVLPDRKINILILGGRIGSSVYSNLERADVKIMTYSNLILQARMQLGYNYQVN